LNQIADRNPNLKYFLSRYSSLLKVLYILIVGGALFLSFSHWAYDDPFITYRYARNLEHGIGFVYNPGDRVMSTTTPLFTMLLAGLGFGWANLPQLANLIGGLSLAFGAVFLWDLANTFGTPMVGWVGLLLYPTFPLLVTTLGSETPLYLALCLGAFAFYARRRYLLTAVITALAILTRPDAALLAIILGIDYLKRYLSWHLKIRGTTTRGEVGIEELDDQSEGDLMKFPWLAIMLFIILILPWYLFAWIYFGSPLPVTLFAKQSQALVAGSQHFAEGFLTIASYYLARWYYLIEMVLALIGLGFVFSKPRRWLLLLSWTGLYFLAYSVLGVSRYYWYYAPLVPGFLVAVGLGFDAVLSWIKAIWGNQGKGLLRSFGNYRTMGLIILLLGLVIFQGGNLWQIRLNPDNRYGVYKAIGLWLTSNTNPGDTVGALEVGIIGYFAQNRMVDFAGLLQPQIATQLSKQGTYEDVAIWAVEKYNPDYLVIHDGGFPRLEDGYVAKECTLAQHFLGTLYAYSSDLSVYSCR
jgi:hypothetical protein